jgi:serine/threonine protein kinase
MLKLMTFDPSKRLTAVQALAHPYFDGFKFNPAPTTGISNAANSSNKNFFNHNNDI